MVLDLSDFGPGCCQIRDLPSPSGSNDQDEMGYTMRKKHQHPRTEEDGGDDEDNTELASKKKAKKNKSETKVDSSSSDHPCFVALVTASNLHKDTLYLPKDFTSSNVLERECRKIVLKDRWERSWALDLVFNKSSDTFYIRRGWRTFCDENGKKAGSFFVFKLFGNRETPLLSFCSTESINDETQGNKNDKESCMEHSTTPIKSRLVTLTIEHESFRKSSLRLPLRFMREHGLDKPRLITLLGKDGAKWVANLLRESTRGRMRLGKGWKDFAIANGLKAGDSFTLEVVWKDNTPMLSLFRTESTSDRTQQGECPKDSENESFFTEPSSLNKTKKAKNNREERSSRKLVRNKCMPNRRDHSLSPTENRFMTLRLTQDSLRKGRLHLLLPYMRENGLDKPGVITLLGKDGMKWKANLLRDAATGRMSLGKSWSDFAKANGLKIGESFTLESIRENGTPMLSLLSTESTSDTRQQGECSVDREKDYFSTQPSSGNKKRKATNNIEETRDSSSAINDRYVTLTYTHNTLKFGRQYLPLSFTRKNGLDKPGMITLLGKDGTKWVSKLRQENNSGGRMSLGKGWRDFAQANGLKTGESFTLESIWEKGIPMLSLFSTESTTDTRLQGECSVTSVDREKEYFSTQPSSGNKTREAKNNIEERKDSSSAIQNHIVTLTLTPEDVRDCKLILPSQFMKANNIIKLGKINLLGKNKMKWFGYLLSKDGTVALGCGWKGFCEANGVKTGEAFTLEYIYEQDTTHVFKFCSNSGE